MNNQFTLYEYIYKEVLTKNLTIDDFSKQIGINPITIKRIQTRKPTETILVKIANGLNVNAWELSQLPITKDKMNKIEFDNNIYAGYTNFNSLLYLNDEINEDMFDIIVNYIFYKLKYSNDKISDDVIEQCIDEYGLDLKVYDRVLEDKYDYFFEDYRVNRDVLTLERFNIVKQFIHHSLHIAYLMSVKDHNINEHIARIKHNDNDDYLYQNDVDELYDLLLKDNSYSNAFDNMNKMINTQFERNRMFNKGDYRDEIKFDEVELAIYLMIMHIKVMQYHRLALPIKHGHHLSDNNFDDRNFIYVDEYRELNEYSVVDSDYSIMGMLCEINFNFLFTTHF